MDDLAFLRKRLAERSITELQVDADESGVPFGTLHKIKYGKTKNPRWDTIQQAVEYYRAKDAAAARRQGRKTARAPVPG